MTTVLECLNQDKKKREIAKKLGFDMHFEDYWDGYVNTKLHQALGTNALIHEAIKNSYEWHAGLIFNEKWLETPERILKLRRYQITENNIVTLYQNGYVESTRELDKSLLDFFGFSSDQIEKYYYMVKEEKGGEKASCSSVPVQRPQENSKIESLSQISGNPGSDIIHHLKVIDNIIEPLDENGHVIKYLNRFYLMVTEIYKFSEKLAIQILKTRVPYRLLKLILEIERSNENITLEDMIREIRQSTFCYQELLDARQIMYFHKFKFGMDPKEYVDTLTEAITTEIPFISDELIAFFILKGIPEKIGLKCIDCNSAQKVWRVLNDAANKIAYEKGVRNKWGKKNFNLNYGANNDDQPNYSKNQQDHQSSKRSYRGRRSVYYRSYRG